MLTYAFSAVSLFISARNFQLLFLSLSVDFQLRKVCHYKQVAFYAFIFFLADINTEHLLRRRFSSILVAYIVIARGVEATHLKIRLDGGNFGVPSFRQLKQCHKSAKEVGRLFKSTKAFAVSLFLSWSLNFFYWSLILHQKGSSNRLW